MEIAKGIASPVLAIPLALAVVGFVFGHFYVEYLKFTLERQQSRYSDEQQWDRKVQEKAAKVAECFALALFLKETSPPSDYQRANQLSWELALWLPEDEYKKMVRAVANPSERENALTFILDVRRLLQGDKAGNLSQDEIMFHAAGAGKGRGVQKP
jgi:hypothetical protein